MNVQILAVTVTTKTTKTGKSTFQNAEVAYKNFDSGKVESKNITQYSKVFKQVVETPPGGTLEVMVNKNENGFWEWDSVKRVVLDDAIKASVPVDGVSVPGSRTTTASPTTAAPRSTYETSEERAKKQVFIVKQSSLSNAIALLSVGAKTSPKEDDVLALAQKFTDFVFDTQEADTQEAELLDIPY